VLLALLGATAGQGVVWYTGQFYALFFLTITLKVDYQTAYTLIGASLLLGTPFFIFFGWLSDKIGRKPIILAGCLIAALTYFPLFKGLTHYVNPAPGEHEDRHHADLRHDGVRADRGVPRRAGIPGEHPVHVDVASVPHRERVVRRHAPAHRDGLGRGVGQHLPGPLVPDHRRGSHVRDRRALPARDEGRQDPRRSLTPSFLRNPRAGRDFTARPFH
jgi:hypothetical protein